MSVANDDSVHSMTRIGSASGKIILSGEYAMAFGYPGIAMPSVETMNVRYNEARSGGFTIIFQRDDFRPEWAMYAGQIAEHLARQSGKTLRGELIVETDLPLGKGMGSSTALVIALARAIIGRNCKKEALAAEDELNPGHSGMDFAVIWEGKPIRFQKGAPSLRIKVPTILKQATLIDAGTPHEQTPALVAWVRSREHEVRGALERIGGCAERIMQGDDVKTVIRDHHAAQVALGVVPEHTRITIAEIEKKGGAAKVIGAGARSGGGGMILALP